jgi:FtsH-binding integral membrane protein
MSYAENPYGLQVGDFAAHAAADARASFITKTYLHLAAAIAVFVGLEAILLNTKGVEDFVGLAFGSRLSWLIVFGAFMLVSTVANSWASSSASPTMQYVGLWLYVAAESVIFVPLLYLANERDPNIIPTAAQVTLGLFGAMTAAVFITRKDFSFLRTFLVFGSFAVLGLFILGMFVPITIGPIFLYALIALACGYILYDTSNVLHHYRIGQHVAASLALFASVALLFWYVVQLFMSRRN